MDYIKEYERLRWMQNDMRSQEVDIFIHKGMVGWLSWRDSLGAVRSQTIEKRYRKEECIKGLNVYEPLVYETIQILSMMVLNIVKEV